MLRRCSSLAAVIQVRDQGDSWRTPFVIMVCGCLIGLLSFGPRSVVGMFLIYNTITFSVVQRRGLIGTLRCIGVSRRQIFALVLGEVAHLGLGEADILDVAGRHLLDRRLGGQPRPDRLADAA